MRIQPFVPAVVCVAGGSFGLACGNSAAPAGGMAEGGASGGDAGNLPGNAISGSVMGMRFDVAATSYWIERPALGGAPTQLYLSDERLACQAISAPGWDKTLGMTSQLLEIGLSGTTVSTFHIRTDADANYLGGPYNPSADGGTVTIAEVHASQNIVGSFDIHFGADALSGTFDASFCATGVEP